MRKSLLSVLTFVLIESLVFAPLSFAQTLSVPASPQQKPQPKQEPAAPEEVVPISTRSGQPTSLTASATAPLAVQSRSSSVTFWQKKRAALRRNGSILKS